MNSYPQQTPLSHGRNKLLIFRWLKIIIIIYCTIGIALYYLQEKFLFHPTSLPFGYKYAFSDSFKEINIDINKNDVLNLVEFYPRDSIKKGMVLYLHGNRENINHYAAFASNFTRHGFEVLMPDYPGFGKTTGELTEKKLYELAELSYKLAHSKYSADSIIIYGKSLGTGLAAQLASRVDCKRLILETPYFSIPDLFSVYAPIYPTRTMAHFKIPTYEYLAKVNAPVTIFHGTNDGVISYSHASKLKNVLKKGDEFVTIEKGTHNNLNEFAEFHRSLDSLFMQ